MSASIVLVAAARLPRWLAYRAVRRHHFSVISPSLTNQKPGGRRLATQPGILDVTPRSGEATEVALRDDAMLDGTTGATRPVVLRFGSAGANTSSTRRTIQPAAPVRTRRDARRTTAPTTAAAGWVGKYCSTMEEIWFMVTREGGWRRTSHTPRGTRVPSTKRPLHWG